MGRDQMQLTKVAIVLTSGLVFAGCSLLPGQTKTEPAPAEEVMIKGELPEEVVGEIEESSMTQTQTVNLTAEDFTFGVKEIRVKQGEKLVVAVLNKEGTHDFVIDELEVSTGIISQGDTIEVEIPTDKPGTYEYYCSVNSHRQMGMKGTLIIE
jgi:plastocyanin